MTCDCTAAPSFARRTALMILQERIAVLEWSLETRRHDVYTSHGAKMSISKEEKVCSFLVGSCQTTDRCLFWLMKDLDCTIWWGFLRQRSCVRVSDFHLFWFFWAFWLLSEYFLNKTKFWAQETQFWLAKKRPTRIKPSLAASKGEFKFWEKTPKTQVQKHIIHRQNTAGEKARQARSLPRKPNP